MKNQNKRYNRTGFAVAHAMSVTLLLLGMMLTSSALNAQTAVGGEDPDASAILDIQSTDAGVLFPRMTATQRDAIANPALSLMLFNTTSSCLEINLGSIDTPAWSAIACLEESGDDEGGGFTNKHSQYMQS